MKDLPEEVDLKDLHVTLDLICLTLPPEVDEEMPQKRPCFQRLTSLASQVSMDSDDDSQYERDDTYSFMATVDTASVHDFNILASYCAIWVFFALHVSAFFILL